MFFACDDMTEQVDFKYLVIIHKCMYVYQFSCFRIDINNTEGTKDNKILCHLGAVYEIETTHTDPTCFMTCGEDGMVRWFDLRVHSKCKKRQCKDVRMSNQEMLQLFL